jgi:hypothetical protein
VRDLALRDGVNLEPVMRLAHGRRDPASDHERQLGCPVSFDAGPERDRDGEHGAVLSPPFRHVRRRAGG